MPEILSNVVIEPINSIFTLQPTSIGVTPEAINLSIFTSAPLTPGNSNVGELLFNSTGTISGVDITNYANGNLTLGNVANVKITGGTNGYVLQTDGAGNLTWTNAPTANAGNGIPGGSNTQIQYNNAGLFGGTSGFTFDSSTGDVAIPGNLTVTGDINGSVTNANYANYAGDVINGYQPNITTVGSLSGLSVLGGATAASFTGDGAGLTNIANANYANFAGTVLTNAQPNITSVGGLTSLSVAGVTSIYTGLESSTFYAPVTGVQVLDLNNSSIFYITGNAIGNVTLNFQYGPNSIAGLLATQQSVISTYILPVGSTPYGVTGIQIDSVAANIKWAGNITPSQIANTTQIYTFTILKTSSTPTYNVYGSATRYG